MSRWALGIVAGLVILGAVRVGLTYSVLSQTFDEPGHLAAGMEWLARGRYTYEDLHPPLARVAVALGPYLAGVRGTDEASLWREGNRILAADGAYARNLTLARSGVLPFFLLSCFVVWCWADHLFGSEPAVLAVGLFSTLPPILAHAGLATTDLPLTATLGLALYSLARWLDTPTIRWSLVLAGALGLAILTKFTAIPVLAMIALILVGHRLRRRSPSQGSHAAPAGTSMRRQVRRAIGVALGAAIIVWAGYRFSVGPLRLDSAVGATPAASSNLRDQVLGWPIYPAPEFWRGLYDVARHNLIGRQAYLLGRTYDGGDWRFFPVSLGVKTPLAFLLLTATGVVVLLARRRRTPDSGLAAPVVAIGVILALAITSNLNIGLRHVLPAYVPLTVIAAAAAAPVAAFPRRRQSIAVLVLLGWQVVAGIRAHPDYLAYFNEVVGRHPERWLVASDLDWGQDLGRLSDALRRHGARQVSISYFGTADWAAVGIAPPDVEAKPLTGPTTGWVAISLADLLMKRKAPWLANHQPVELVGRSILLYHIPPAG